MQTSRSVRRLGWTLLVIGAGLVGLMGTITVTTLPSLLPVGNALGPDRFNGMEEQAQSILTLFGLVIAFGLASAFNGVWQILSGRRNRLVLLLTLVPAVALVFAAYSTIRALG